MYLEPRLFNEGQRPAVDVGRSVSRVGGHAQAPLLAALSGNLRLQYTQFLELEAFTRYGAMLDEHTRRQLEHGRRIRAVLVQRRFVPMRVEEEVALLVALEEGLLDDIPSALLPTRIEEIRSAAREQLAAMVQRVVDAALSATDRSALREALREALPPPRTGG
ncbi:MAG TPA: hypothetical protein ENK18_09105 [Deltaproteobacteria bacterium]|nr:hypothetical protein [Deltaproteobacteria bacterium]